mgnify:CR=1 FL=1
MPKAETKSEMKTEEKKNTKNTKKTEQVEQTAKTSNTSSKAKTEKTVKKSKKKDVEIPVDDLKFMTQLKEKQNEAKQMKDAMSVFLSDLKKLESAYNHDIKLVKKAKRKKDESRDPTGFVAPKPVPEKFARFLEIEPGTMLSGPQITSKVWTQLKKRDLLDKEDGRVLRIDKNGELAELFGITDSVNASNSYTDKSGFNFCTLQSLISKLLKSPLEASSEETEDKPAKITTRATKDNKKKASGSASVAKK